MSLSSAHAERTQKLTFMKFKTGISSRKQHWVVWRNIFKIKSHIYDGFRYTLLSQFFFFPSLLLRLRCAGVHKNFWSRAKSYRRLAWNLDSLLVPKYRIFFTFFFLIPLYTIYQYIVTSFFGKHPYSFIYVCCFTTSEPNVIKHVTDHGRALCATRERTFSFISLINGLPSLKWLRLRHFYYYPI